jgi:flavin reductase (DIM6/NTAB) family NADH-FMN oxidoreductase RutF
MTPSLELITSPAAEAVSAADFSRAMSALAGGVAIVTCRMGGRPWGTTVTAVASVSADPPTILVSLGAEGRSARTITVSGRFGVSLLGQEHADLARYASSPGSTRFFDAFVERDPAGSRSPVVVGALAHLDCELAEELQVADHIVFFGRVRHVQASPGGAPLLYFRRAYRALAGLQAVRPSTGRSTECPSS